MNMGRRSTCLLLGSSAALAIAAAAPSAALAQDRPPAAAPAADVANDPGEIIVTAQRREQRLEDVPVAITAISAASAENKGVRALIDLGQAIAGVQINFQGSFTYPAIRGVSSLTTGVGFENNVGVYIDGFYQPDVTAINADFANLEGIEVLKGPQGALYGRNATGGAILINTLRPSTTFTGKAEVRYGNFDEKVGSLYLSGPLSKGIRLSAALFGSKSDGYYDFLSPTGVRIGDAAPTHTYSARLKGEIDLGPDLLATVGFNYTDFSDPRGSMFTDQDHRLTQPVKVGRLYDTRTFASNRGEDGTFTKTKIVEPTLKVEWKLGDFGKLTSYSSYAHRHFHNAFDFDASYADTSYSAQNYYEKTYQQGLDLNVAAISNLDLVVGGSFYKDTTITRYSDSFSNNLQTGRTYQVLGAKAFAAYADGTFHFSDHFSVGLGGRYTDERRSTDFVASAYSGGVPVATTSFPATQLRSTHFRNFSPRGVVTLEVADRTNVYASVSRGFRSGILQPVSTTLPAPVGLTTLVNKIRPEKITAYEIGFKTARSNFRFDAAAFYYDYKDIQVGLTLPNPLCSTCGPLNILANAPKAEVYGVEAQGSAKVTRNFNLNASAAYLHDRYKTFPGVTSTGLNIATNFNVANQVQDWSGHEMARAPKFTATFGGDYTVPGIAGGSLTLNGNLKYTTSYVPNSPALYGPLYPAKATVQRYRQGEYTLINLALNWTDKSGAFTVGAFVRNIGDVDYKLSYNGSIFGDYSAWAPPRQYGVRGSVKW